jgi:hypothetical protein
MPSNQMDFIFYPNLLFRLMTFSPPNNLGGRLNIDILCNERHYTVRVSIDFQIDINFI